MAAKKHKLKVAALGGLGEIGKNITIFEYGNDIIVVDAGIGFPSEEMLGVDLVTPDFSYLVANKNKIRGILFTHGHEDHIGSIPYLLKQINAPIYGTKLTLGLIELKFKEHKIDNAVMNCVSAGDSIRIGGFDIEFIAVTHSIADCVAICIKTPCATVVHTGDFKIDHTPINNDFIDLQRFAELGREGVDLLLCDSTNVASPGFTMSEKSVGKVFDKIFDLDQNKRIIIATFASNIPRIQQAINSATARKRKIAFSGRSIESTVRVARELGYLDIPQKSVIDAGQIKMFEDHQVAIITTGSQGETMSALHRMAHNEHKHITIKPNDKIIISASAIPGNEKAITRVIDELLKKGADVIYEDQGLEDVHVSGHAKAEELKIMHSLIKPKFFMPVHGEFRHLTKHKELAIDLGMDKDNVFVMRIGDVLELNRNEAKITGTIESGFVYVDGIQDIGSIVLRDRKLLSEDGILAAIITYDSQTFEMASEPYLITRGFIYVKDAEELILEAIEVVRDSFNNFKLDEKLEDFTQIRNFIKKDLRKYVWDKTKREPMILPVILEVN